jgi:hypothetical protein
MTFYTLRQIAEILGLEPEFVEQLAREPAAVITFDAGRDRGPIRVFLDTVSDRALVHHPDDEW